MYRKYTYAIVHFYYLKNAKKEPSCERKQNKNSQKRCKEIKIML